VIVVEEGVVIEEGFGTIGQWKGLERAARFVGRLECQI
jgi:hypothetical protein